MHYMHGICSPRGEQCTQSSGWGGPEHAWYLFSKGWTVYPKFWMGRPWTCLVSVLQGVNSVPKVLDGEALNMHGICSPRGEQCTQSSGWGGPEHAWYLFSKGWTVYPKFWMRRPWTCMVSVLQEKHKRSIFQIFFCNCPGHWALPLNQPLHFEYWTRYIYLHMLVKVSNIRLTAPLNTLIYTINFL